MLYLLDADTLITADRTFYRLKRFTVFWEWLKHNGVAGQIKIPLEQYEEVVVGKGDLVDWLKEKEVREALLLDEEADPALVTEVIERGYAPDLNDADLVKVGRDPFLIAYGYADPAERFVVTFEVSRPNSERSNRKIPDVCDQLGIGRGTIFDVIEALDFTTDWTP